MTAAILGIAYICFLVVMLGFMGWLGYWVAYLIRSFSR